MPWPELRICTAYLSSGQGGLPQRVRLNEGLATVFKVNPFPLI